MKWEGYPIMEASWEPEETSLINTSNVITYEHLDLKHRFDTIARWSVRRTGLVFLRYIRSVQEHVRTLWQYKSPCWRISIRIFTLWDSATHFILTTTLKCLLSDFTSQNCLPPFYLPTPQRHLLPSWRMTAKYVMFTTFFEANQYPMLAFIIILLPVLFGTNTSWTTGHSWIHFQWFHYPWSCSPFTTFFSPIPSSRSSSDFNSYHHR